VQGNTNLSSLLDVGPSFARTRINPRVFSLHHHPGKSHAAFTRWFRTPLGPNTDRILSANEFSGEIILIFRLCLCYDPRWILHIDILLEANIVPSETYFEFGCGSSIKEGHYI
jgi:hypothetical protein